MKKARTVKDVALLRPTEAGQQRLRGLLDNLHTLSLGGAICAGMAPYFGLRTAPALDRAISQYVNTHKRGPPAFVECVLGPAVKCALEFDELFAFRQEQRCCRAGQSFAELNARHMALSRRQLFCVVANAFFGTFPHRRQDQENALPTIDYAEIHVAPDGENDVEVVKLRLLFDYFAKVGALTRKAAMQVSVDVFRPALIATGRFLSHARFRLCMLPPVIHELRESIDEQRSMLRLDFANRWIGGGALSDGCVQEEITFAQCPELNALRWIHGPMLENESIVVRGYSQYASIKEGTYGGGIAYGGPVLRARKLGGALLAVDAIDYRCEEPSVQFSAAAVGRELFKLVSALSVDALDAIKNVAGGNWGCGVFGGDVELKFLIQWLACNLCGKVLHYFPFDKPVFRTYAPVMRRLCDERMTGEDLMTFLSRLESSGFDSAFSGSVVAELLLYRTEAASGAAEETDV